MRGSLKVVLLLFAAAVSGCGGSGGSSGTPLPLPTLNSAPIDAIVQQNYAGGWGVELAIYKNGNPVYTHGYGFRDRGLPDIFNNSVPDFWNVPQPEQVLHLPRGQFAPDVNTVFHLASVSKEFTAGAILLLQQDGKLSVNDPVSKYFPSIPNGQQIPLLYLLQHRSGLIDYNNFGDYPDFTGAYQAFMASGQTNYQPIVDRLASFPLKFTPGTAYDYENSNYFLLGQIVAKLSGETLAQFLQQRIFGPLGMVQTNQDLPPAPATDFALGYRDDGAGPYRTYEPNLRYYAGPGGMTSTVGDIERWDRAVQHPGIFSQQSLAQMFAPSPFPQPYGTYADGWFISSLNGHPYIWHDGALRGFQTMNAISPTTP